MKYIYLLMVVIMATGLNAQTKFGVQGGVNLAKMNVTENGNKSKNSSITNFYIKGYADIPMYTNLSLQPGISFEGKGGKDQQTSTKFVYQAIDIPVNVVYHLPLNSNEVYVGAGPFVGFNLSGKVKYGDGTSEDIGFGPIFDSNGDEWKRFDYGVNFLVGYKLSNGFLVNANYNLGLANIDPLQNWKRHNRAWSFGLGYEF